MKKKKKKKSNEWHRKKCVTKAKEEAKKKAGYKCERCGRTKEQGYQMHGSHIYSEGKYKSMSADVHNILCLCAICHFWWHENPIASSEWFRGKFSKLAIRLKNQSQTLQIINWEKKYLLKDNSVV